MNQRAGGWLILCHGAAISECSLRRREVSAWSNRDPWNPLRWIWSFWIILILNTALPKYHLALWRSCLGLPIPNNNYLGLLRLCLSRSLYVQSRICASKDYGWSGHRDIRRAVWRSNRNYDLTWFAFGAEAHLGWPCLKTLYGHEMSTHGSYSAPSQGFSMEECMWSMTNNSSTDQFPRRVLSVHFHICTLHPSL